MRSSRLFWPFGLHGPAKSQNSSLILRENALSSRQASPFLQLFLILRIINHSWQWSRKSWRSLTLYSIRNTLLSQTTVVSQYHFTLALNGCVSSSNLIHKISQTSTQVPDDALVPGSKSSSWFCGPEWIKSRFNDRFRVTVRGRLMPPKWDVLRQTWELVLNINNFPAPTFILKFPLASSRAISGSQIISNHWGKASERERVEIFSLARAANIRKGVFCTSMLHV